MDVTQIILIVFIVLLLIAYPIMVFSKNKKEGQRMQEQTNSLKRGDKVLTTSGVYGTIVDLKLEEDKKIVTIETGTDKKKGYISVDAYAIYQIFKDEPVEEPKSNDTQLNVEEQINPTKKGKTIFGKKNKDGKENDEQIVETEESESVVLTENDDTDKN